MTNSRPKRTVNNQIVRDLGMHFYRRIATEMNDIMDTAERAGIGREAQIAMVLTALGRIIARSAIMSGATRKDFSDWCGEIFDDELNESKRSG